MREFWPTIGSLHFKAPSINKKGIRMSACIEPGCCFQNRPFSEPVDGEGCESVDFSDTGSDICAVSSTKIKH